MLNEWLPGAIASEYVTVSGDPVGVGAVSVVTAPESTAIVSDWIDGET